MTLPICRFIWRCGYNDATSATSLHAKCVQKRKQANRKIMADIEKSHHSQDLARVRTESFKTLLD